MSGLMIDYNAMTKCLEEAQEAQASSENRVKAAQEESNNLKVDIKMLQEQLDKARQQLSDKESELEDCKIRLKWAQTPRYISSRNALNIASIMTCHDAPEQLNGHIVAIVPVAKI
jgi:chromosome segregation ATPase